VSIVHLNYYMKKVIWLFILVFPACISYGQKKDKYFNRMNPVIRGYEGRTQTAEEYFKHGTRQMEAGYYQEAIDDFTMAIQIEPRYPEAFNNRGIIRRNLKDFKGAIEDLNQAIILDPENKEAYNNLGNVKLDQGDYQGAINDYTKAIELDHRLANAYHNRGLAKSELRDFAGAIGDFDRAIKIIPRFAIAYANRGRVKITSGLKEEGCSDLNKSVSLGYSPANEIIAENCQ